MQKNGIDDFLKLSSKFAGPNLTSTINMIETEILGLRKGECSKFLESSGACADALTSAAAIKKIAGQINVTIHALGILRCLPHLLNQDEMVEYVSLGAGNTGREFDLETNQRIAEFKFINWQGGAESIRQNSIFKDFYLLQRSNSQKRKCLYVLGTKYPIKFFKGGRSLNN